MFKFSEGIESVYLKETTWNHGKDFYDIIDKQYVHGIFNLC